MVDGEKNEVNYTVDGTMEIIKSVTIGTMEWQSSFDSRLCQSINLKVLAGLLDAPHRVCGVGIVTTFIFLDASECLRYMFLNSS